MEKREKRVARKNSMGGVLGKSKKAGEKVTFWGFIPNFATQTYRIMNATTVESKKYQLITQITRLDDEAVLNRLEQVLTEAAGSTSAMKSLFKPMRKKLRIEDLKKNKGIKA
jgi:hypothetical protein